MSHPAGTAPSGRPSALPAAIGVALAALAILGLGLWTASRPDTAHPTVTLISPAQDTSVSGELALRFRSSRPLVLQPTGWGTGRYHLHVLVNGQERMPGPNDIRALDSDLYQWRLTDLPDSARVQLVWALPNHQRLAEGASHTVRVNSRP